MTTVRSRSGRNRHVNNASIDATDDQYVNANEELILMMAEQRMPEEYRIPSALFRCIPKSALLEFLRNRRELMRNRTQGRTNPSDQTGENQPSATNATPTSATTSVLPRQYSRPQQANVNDIHLTEMNDMDDEELITMIANLYDTS